MGFQIVGVFLGAYMSPFNPERSYFPPEARASTPLSLAHALTLI